MGKYRRWLIAGTVFAVSLTGLFLIWVARTQMKLSFYDPANYGPNGLKAVSLLLEREGYRIGRLSSLNREYNQLLIIPTYTELNPRQRKALLSWVYSGGTLLELAQYKPLLQPGSLEIPRFRTVVESDDTLPAVSSNIEWLNNLKYHLHSRYLATVAKPDAGFYAVRNRFFIYLQNYGAGRIIYWNDLDGLININLKRYPDNAVVFTLIVKKYNRSGQVNFFEIPLSMAYQPPELRRPTDLSRFWMVGIIAFSGLVILLWKISARFGRPRPLILARGRSADEFVDAMASLFIQANTGSIVLDNLYEDVINTIVKITGAPWTDDLEVQAVRLEAVTGIAYQPQLLEIAELGRKLKTAKLSRMYFLEIAIKLDNYRKEFAKWKSLKKS